MKSIHVQNSYNIWEISVMKAIIKTLCRNVYGTDDALSLLNRSYVSMYIEWWLHNIGYYITKPFCSNKSIFKINLRFRHVDLEEWTNNKWFKR